MTDKFDYQFQILTKEMEMVQNGIETYNRTIFTIKGWVITIFAAFSVFAGENLSNGTDLHDLVYVVIIGVFVVFWVQEAIFKTIQRVYIERAVEIEDYLKSPAFKAALEAGSLDDVMVDSTSKGFTFPKIEKSFVAWEKDLFRRMMKTLPRPTISWIYLPVIIVVLLLWLADSR